MTDKQIIIDGVDVSGCEFRFRTYGCDCMSSNRETKALTESSRCADNPNCYYKQLKRKEQECKKWNLKIIELNSMNETLKSECENCEHLDLYMKYKQTLTGIKEIVEKGVKIHDDIIVSKQILQKINEVENG